MSVLWCRRVEDSTTTHFTLKLALLRRSNTLNVLHCGRGCVRSTIATEEWSISVGRSGNSMCIHKCLINLTTSVLRVFLHSLVEAHLHWLWEIGRAQDPLVSSARDLKACLIRASLSCYAKVWHAWLLSQLVQRLTIVVPARSNLAHCLSERVVIDTAAVKPIVLAETST